MALRQTNTTKRIIKLLLTMLLITAILLPSTVSVANTATTISTTKILVYGKELELKVQPQTINGRIMVPLRPIFEAIGLDVGWNPETKNIIGTKNELVVSLVVGEKNAYINNKLETLDVPPIIVDGNTLVPVRFIAEATGLRVRWDEYTKTVLIDELVKAEVYKENDKEFITGYNEESFLKLTKNNNKLNIQGKVEGYWGLLKLYNSSGREISSAKFNIPTNGNINENIDLTKLEGTYSVSVYINNDKNDNYAWSYYTDIPITVKDRNLSFEPSVVYEDNLKEVMKNSIFSPRDYLSLNHIKEDERKVLINLAEEITRGIDSDYDKLLAINNWISNNIYYDYDGYYSQNYGRTDAYGTYESRRSVCQGYAELTLALGRAVGIPTRLVSGYGLGLSTNKTWDESSLSAGSNHAWNEAFIEDRWVILDTTWNTFNKYENKSFIEGRKRLRYFDISLIYFSETHRIISEFD